MHAIKTVFFDVGNTLLFPDRDRIYPPLWNVVARPESALLYAIEAQTKREFDGSMAGHGPDHGFWFLFYSHLLEAVGVRNDEVRDQLVESTRISANWALPRPGTRQSLERIAKKYSIAVISNADGSIAQTLRTSDLADCFPSITDSGIVGVEKPHPKIFEAALRDMKAAPQTSLYVGDIYSVDYVGATRAGMQAVLFDVCGAYKKTDLPRVESLEELEKQLTSK